MSLGRLCSFARNLPPRRLSISAFRASEEANAANDLFPAEDGQPKPTQRRRRPGINQVQLLGGVADNPLQRVARNGKEYCTFNMFTNIEQRRADGSFSEHADLHSIVAHGPLARFIVNNVQRGTRVLVSGRLTYTGGQQSVSGSQLPRQCVINAEIVQPIARTTGQKSEN